jgi:hypothetical protein
LRGLLLILFIITNSAASGGPAVEDCAMVQGMYVTNVMQGSIRLVWEKSADAEGYMYVVSKSSVPPEKYGKFTKETELTESGLAAGATYYAHVRIKCKGIGVSQWASIQFNTPAPYNKEVTLDNAFALLTYPSQADKSVTIKIKGSNEQVATVWVEDMYGTEVGYYPLVGDRLHIDVAPLKNGIYYICYNDYYGRLQWTRFTKYDVTHI